jgi:hypothetical protein
MEQNNAIPSFVSSENVNECGCVPQGLYLARAALGLSPLYNLATINDIEDLRKKLQTEAASIGGKLAVRPLDATLRSMKKATVGSQPLLVVVHRNGHFYGLLGTMDIDGTRLFQLVHGDSQVWLASKEQMNRAGFKEVWHLQPGSRGVPFRVGDGELIIDKVYENFGELKPQQEVRGTFILENTGKKTIILGVPQTSCTCTIPNIKESTKLEPGGKKEMEVIFQSGASTSARQTIVMKCYEEGTGVSQTFPLELFGNQRRSMEIMPTSLDFGLVVPSEEVFRTINLKEMPTDRFTILKVDVGQLPITYTRQEEIAPDGLKFYRTEFKFVLQDEKIEGNQSGVIEFTTDSKQFPNVKIPVVYKVAPVIRAIPSIVSFGMLKVGEKAESKVEFEARTGEPVAAIVKSLPNSVTFEKKSDAYLVSFMPEQSGIWENVLELELKSGSNILPLPLKCVAFVKE